MWNLVDDRFRVAVQIRDLAEHFDAYYTLMNEALLRMREQGRIKYADCKARKTYVYEVSNPNTYDRLNPDTQVIKPKKPVWG